MFQGGFHVVPLLSALPVPVPSFGLGHIGPVRRFGWWPRPMCFCLQRPPRLVDWGAEGGGGVRRGSAGYGHGECGGGLSGDEAAATAAGEAVEDGPGAAATAEACGARPPVKPSDWPTITKRQRKNWYERGDGQRGNASAEAARTAASGATEDGPGAAAPRKTG